MISPIAIDLGGKNTGFFSFTNSLDNSQSGTIIYDDSFVLSQVKRRGKRHGKRNNLRNKLAKRLFLLILQKNYNCDIGVLPDEIRGLFNKRGYTYASFEIKDDEREHLESDVLKEFLNENLTYFNIKNDIEVEDFLNQIASDETTLTSYKKEFESLFANSIHKPKKQFELVENISKELEKNDAKELLNGLKMVKKIVDEFDKQKNQGNLPRVKYFKELGKYIATNEKVESFFDSNSLKLQAMTNLIGNISNYQLKELRRYFNDEGMAKGDIWLSEKLHRITMRFARSWHPKDDETKARRVRTIESLKTQNIIEFLTSTNPTETISPYDDMNNRGAVKCQTLRLNEECWGRHFPDWRKITAKLTHGNFGTDTSESTVKGWSEDSTLLHRLLDTSRDIDIYGLRGKNPSEMLVTILGQSDANKLHNFASEYYELLRSKVRGGIWTSSDDMLKVCGKNPPHKGTQVHNLVAGIFGVEISSDRFKAFEDELWNVKFGNRKLSSYCKNLEELRKSHGNLFKSYIDELRKKEPTKLTKDEKSEIALTNNETLNEWSQKIANFFDVDDKHRQRFNNLFSMAQLHTIIDTPRSGFNSTCKCCSAENRFRSQSAKEVFDATTGEKITTEYYDEKNVIIRYENANCQRLPADTQRPFSGKIERYIDKIGYELAKVKAKELENITAEIIEIPIVLEQNAFEYEESIRSAKIKNANKKANEKLEKAFKNSKKSLEDKNERIKTFSGGICPYCGEALGDDGEIDHILPRSLTLTRKYGGTVFNSEGNLIYVHQKCNQAKRESIYKAGDIKISIDSTWVEGQIESIGKSYKTFSALNLDQQRAFRYALFLPNDNEAYQKVVGWLRTDQSSRVNGTQKYLAKKIQEKLTKMLPNKKLSFEFILADANDVHDLRIKKYKLPEKPKDAKQEANSHTIDAVISLVSVWGKVIPSSPKPDIDNILKFVNVENWSATENEFLTKGKSTNIKIEDAIRQQDFGRQSMNKIFGKSIFGENALGERFKPIIKHKEGYLVGYPIKIRNGYDLNRCKSIESKSDKVLIEKIITSSLVTKTEKSEITLYEINKFVFNEWSNQYFNLNYKHLSESQKSQAEMLEFVVKNCKYYTKKVDVKYTPSYAKEMEGMKYPFYNEWRLFDEAWKHLQINENKNDFRDRYLIDKNRNNTSYQIDTKKGEYKLDGDIAPLWFDFCRWYFLDRFKKEEDNKNIRTKARKTFSLIAEGVAQGTVFRLKRKTPKGFVYQALPIDNKQIAGDYANILLEGNKKTISLVTREAKKELVKELHIKESKDIRDIKVESSKFFKDEFDATGIEVILNKTSATIKNFPLEKVKSLLSGNLSKLYIMYILGRKQKQSYYL